MIIYQIRLPQKQDAEAFVKFMREEYLPAVRKTPTRAGQVTALMLLERENEFDGDDVEHEFFLHVGWDGVRASEIHVDNDEVGRKFRAFKAPLKRLGSFAEVAAWREHNAV